MRQYESKYNKSILLLWYNAIDELFIVIPRCCSSRLLSMYLNFPTIFWDITPLLATKESASVVLPWSTWAIMQILRIESGLCWSSISLFCVRSLILFLYFFFSVECNKWWKMYMIERASTTKIILGRELLVTIQRTHYRPSTGKRTGSFFNFNIKYCSVVENYQLGSGTLQNSKSVLLSFYHKAPTRFYDYHNFLIITVTLLFNLKNSSFYNLIGYNYNFAVNILNILLTGT